MTEANKIPQWFCLTHNLAFSLNTNIETHFNTNHPCFIVEGNVRSFVGDTIPSNISM